MQTQPRTQKVDSVSKKVYQDEIIAKAIIQEDVVYNTICKTGPASAREIHSYIQAVGIHNMDIVSLRRALSDLKNPKKYDPVKVVSCGTGPCPITGRTVNFWNVKTESN